MYQLRILLYFVILFLAACKQKPRPVQSGEVVNVYTACYQPSDEQLFEHFEKATGIHVNIFYDHTSNLLSKLQQQGNEPEADLLILKGICDLRQARNDNLLQLMPHQFKTKGPQQLDSANYWSILTYDPLAIAYLHDGSVMQPPASYTELAKEEWKDKLLLSAKPNLMHSLTVTMLADRGEEATLEWLEQCKENLAPKGTIQQALPRMGTGSASIALITVSEYLKASRPSNIKIIFPNQDNKGTCALVRGVGLVRDAPHPTYAERLLSFLLNTETQKAYAQAHAEYPANGDVQISSSLQTLGSFQLHTASIVSSESYCEQALLLLQEAGF